MKKVKKIKQSMIINNIGLERKSYTREKQTRKQAKKLNRVRDE